MSGISSPLTSEDRGIKRQRDEESLLPAKRARTTGILVSVHTFDKINENEFLSTSFVDDAFLKNVFINSDHVDFSKLRGFYFAGHPKLGPKTPEMINTYCPHLFDMTEKWNFFGLDKPQFCDHALLVRGELIPINKWF